MTVVPYTEDSPPETKLNWFQKARNVLTRLAKAPGRAYGTAIPSDWGEMPDYDHETLLKKFKQDDAIRDTTETIADACTALGWELIPPEDEEIDQKVKEWIEADPLAWISFLRNLSISLYIGDEAYFEVCDPMFRVLEPQYIAPVAGDKGQIVGYVQNVPGKQPLPLTTNDIVHPILTPIGTALHGHPRIVTLKMALETKLAAMKFNFGIFHRKGVPAKAIIMEQGTPQDYKRLQKRLKNAKPDQNLLLRGKLNVIDIGGKQRDLEYGRTMDKIDGMIGAVQHVPPIMRGASPSSGQGAMQGSINVFTLRVHAVQSVLSASLTVAFKIRFNTKNIFRLIPWMDMETEVRSHAIAVNSGSWTINESRIKMGLPKIPKSLDPEGKANTPKPFWASQMGGMNPGGGQGGGFGERMRGGTEREPGLAGASVSASPTIKAEGEELFMKPGFEETENEIRYRLRDPDQYSTCRSKSITAGVRMIYCKRKDGDGWETQALRFAKPPFDMAKAKAWYAEHKESFGKGLEFEIQLRTLALIAQKERILDKIENGGGETKNG